MTRVVLHNLSFCLSFALAQSGSSTLTLNNLLFWTAAIVAVIAQVLVIVSIVRQRQRWDRQGAVGPNLVRAEILWTVVPALGLVVLLVATYAALG